MCFYYVQVSTAAVAVVDQGPIRKLVNEVAGIFRKWMEGNAVDNDQRILLRLEVNTVQYDRLFHLILSEPCALGKSEVC
jgi:hypothetical protein